MGAVNSQLAEFELGMLGVVTTASVVISKKRYEL